MALGSSCGRVTIYAVPKMATIKIVEVPVRGVAVLTLLFVHDNQGMVVTYNDGSVFLIDLNKSVSEPSARLVTNSGNATNILCDAHGSDHYWGLLKPASSELDIFKVVSVPVASKKGEASMDLQLVKLWSCIVKDRLTLNKFEIGKQLSEVGMHMLRARLIPCDDGFLVKILCYSADKEYSLATVMAERRKSYERDLIVKEVLLAYPTVLQDFISCAFVGDMCVVATTSSILVMSLARRSFGGQSALVSASLRACDYLNGGGSWANTALAASTGTSTEDAYLTFFALSYSRPALLKVLVKAVDVEDLQYED
jgi:hypothetical protein